MNSVPNVSSEEELLQLRNDGRISQAEYSELLNAMKTPPANSEARILDADRSKAKRRQGKIAFTFLLVGIILPVVCFFTLEILIATGPNVHAIIAPWFFLGLAFEIAAFVLGVISWPDVFGKAAALTTSVLFVLIVVLAVLTI
jgi:hypothetical protein